MFHANIYFQVMLCLWEDCASLPTHSFLSQRLMTAISKFMMCKLHVYFFLSIYVYFLSNLVRTSKLLALCCIHTWWLKYSVSKSTDKSHWHLVIHRSLELRVGFGKLEVWGWVESQFWHGIGVKNKSGKSWPPNKNTFK